jgi:dienelactone hydrolase
MKRILIAMCFVLACATTPQTVVQSQEVTYRAGDTVLKGYLAYDDSIQGRRPGILVVHEWWGHNAYARKRARMLAELGYTALAVDMYGEGKQAAHPGDAGKFASEVKQNLPLAKERFMAAMELLKQQPTVDSTHIAAIGYCFGGGIVLEMARAGLDLDGVVSFHGSLGTTTGDGYSRRLLPLCQLFWRQAQLHQSRCRQLRPAVLAPFGLRPGGRYTVLAGNAEIL